MLSASDKAFEDRGHRNAGWLAIHTRYQHESLAARSLAYKGFEVFLPEYTCIRRWSDRTRELVAPLFPGYVFLREEFKHHLKILTTPGVLGLVGFAGAPAIIPDIEIEAVRQTLATRVRVEPHPYLKCGDWVRVKSGPLEGVEGILARNKKQFRLVLSVQLLQKSVAVEVDAWMVERAAKLDWRGTDRPQIFDSRPCA